MRVIMSMNVLMPSWSYLLLMSNVLFKPSLASSTSLVDYLADDTQTVLQSVTTRQLFYAGQNTNGTLAARGRFIIHQRESGSGSSSHTIDDSESAMHPPSIGADSDVPRIARIQASHRRSTASIAHLVLNIRP